MDLYITPLSASLATHVALLESGLPFTLRRVARGTRTLDDGRDYRAIVSTGHVPALGLDDGSVLTETSAVLQWIADHAPDKHLAPPWGTPARYRLLEWLNLVTSELHKKHMAVVFGAGTPAAVKSWARDGAAATLGHVAARLGANEYALGERFSVADAYLYWTLFVAPHAGIALEPWPALVRYAERIARRPSVVAAFAVEGPLFALDVAAGAAPSASA